MARKWEQYFEVGNGPNPRRVGYSLKKRGKVWVAQFEGPDGEYLRKSTGKATATEAEAELAKVIVRAYADHYPMAADAPKAVTWDAAVKALESALSKNNNRQSTFGDYLSTLNVLRATVDTESPADITEDTAKRFADLFLSTGYKRGRKKAAATYQRSHSALNTHLRKLRTIWSKWFGQRWGYVTANPWKAVPYAEVDDEDTAVPPDAVFADFVAWVKVTYGTWELPVLFVRAKSYLGCRLADVCALRSDQLNDFKIVFDGTQLKARNRRTVPISEEARELYTALDRIKGPSFLWESFAQGQISHLQAVNQYGASARCATEFSPDTLRHFAHRLFKRWNKANPGRKLNSHDFRRRAVTKAFVAGLTPDQVGRMFGLDPQTAMKYYRDWQAQTVDAEFAAVPGLVL